MRENEQRQDPFKISLGQITFVNRVVQVPEISIEVNGVVFDGSPTMLLEFFDLLMEEHPAQTEGMELDVEPGFLDLLLKSRVAFLSPDNTIYPTDGFRQIARDLLGHLRSQISTAGYVS